MNNEGRKLLCKNDLIDCIKKYKPIELKVFYNMLYTYKEQTMYKEELFDDDYIHMKLSKLDNYLGDKHFSKKEILKIITNIPKGIYSKDGTTYISVFSIIIYEEEELKYKINEEFKPYLDDIVNEFTVLELQELASINGIYSQRLFEFASKNNNLAEYKMKIEDFRKYFQIPDGYKQGNIDQKVINPMLNEVNSKTKFDIRLKKIKRNNKVTHVLFILK